MSRTPPGARYPRRDPAINLSFQAVH